MSFNHGLNRSLLQDFFIFLAGNDGCCVEICVCTIWKLEKCVVDVTRGKERREMIRLSQSLRSWFFRDENTWAGKGREKMMNTEMCGYDKSLSLVEAAQETRCLLEHNIYVLLEWKRHGFPFFWHACREYLRITGKRERILCRYSLLYSSKLLPFLMLFALHLPFPSLVRSRTTSHNRNEGARKSKKILFEWKWLYRKDNIFYFGVLVRKKECRAMKVCFLCLNAFGCLEMVKNEKRKGFVSRFPGLSLCSS